MNEKKNIIKKGRDFLRLFCFLINFHEYYNEARQKIEEWKEELSRSNIGGKSRGKSRGKSIRFRKPSSSPYTHINCWR